MATMQLLINKKCLKKQCFSQYVRSIEERSQCHTYYTKNIWSIYKK